LIDFIWLMLFCVGLVTAVFTGQVSQVSEAILGGAAQGVELSIALISVIAFWLGIMNIAEKAGLVGWLCRPEDHPAMGTILSNMCANILGLGNAATPLGLKAMQELQTLNADKETASDAMCTLLAINTASITLIPTTVIAVRMQSGSDNPTSIVGTTLIATLLGTIAAVILDRLFRRFAKRRRA
jgi:spore maturation protein A